MRLAYLCGMLAMGVCATRHCQAPGRLVQELNVCTVSHRFHKICFWDCSYSYEWLSTFAWLLVVFRDSILMQQAVITVVKDAFTDIWYNFYKAMSNETICHIHKALGTQGIHSPCGLFAAENRGNRNIAIRVPQGVGLNRRGCEIQNQWSWTVERFANMFANQSTVHDLPTDIYWLSVWHTAIFNAVQCSPWECLKALF